MVRRTLGGLVLLNDGATIGRDRGYRPRCDRRHLLLALERRFYERRQLGLLLGIACHLIRLQGWHHFRGKELQRIADMLVLVAAALLNEHHLVDARLLVALQMLGELGRRADAAPLPDGRQLVLGRLEALPHVGDARLMMAIDIVVAERIAEELEALGAPASRLVAILVA